MSLTESSQANNIFAHFCQQLQSSNTTVVQPPASLWQQLLAQAANSSNSGWRGLAFATYSTAHVR